MRRRLHREPLKVVQFGGEPTVFGFQPLLFALRCAKVSKQSFVLGLQVTELLLRGQSLTTDRRRRDQDAQEQRVFPLPA
jgi:hypothetical protein